VVILRTASLWLRFAPAEYGRPLEARTSILRLSRAPCGAFWEWIETGIGRTRIRCHICTYMYVKQADASSAFLATRLRPDLDQRGNSRGMCKMQAALSLLKSGPASRPRILLGR
jgi:hypothetical protein